MNDTAKLYKLATERVMIRWRDENDDLNRSQTWKISTLERDVAEGKDSSVVQQFTREVEETVNLLETTPILTAGLLKSVEKKGESIAAEPVIPHGGA